MTEAEQFLKERGLPLMRDHMMFEMQEHLASGDRILFNESEDLTKKRVNEHMRQYAVREEFIARFGFAILTSQAVSEIVKYSPLLEVGAGSGYWSYELRKAGADIIATDSGDQQFFLSTFEDSGGRWSSTWCEVEKVDATNAVLRYHDRNLLVVWPSYNNHWAARALANFIAKYVLYVGEGSGGCTADDAFHQLLEERFELEREIGIPQFRYLHDSLYVYRRK